MGVPKERVSWLKETLGTKDEKQAKILAKPVMMKFDRILAQAEALLVEHPVRTELTEAEIKQIADYFYAHELGADEAQREEGIGSDPGFASIHRQLTEAGIEFETLNELLQLFRIKLDPACADYRKLALAVIKAWVRTLEAVLARNRGAPIDTPKLVEPSSKAPVSSCSLRAAYEGWDKMEQRPISTRMEFSRGIDRFIELHGDLDVAQINRGHVRAFRNAAQLVPRRRTGKLRNAPLPELAEWTRNHPGTVCISAPTINKWLTCLQSVLNWARKNGLIPDEVAWADPVAGMRLKEPRSKRRPWEPEELSVLFGSPIYTQGARPKGGKGEAAYWLPLLALCSGARLNELAPMCANDVKLDAASGVRFLDVIEDDEVGRSLKTETSVRAVPIHPVFRAAIGRMGASAPSLDCHCARSAM